MLSSESRFFIPLLLRLRISMELKALPFRVLDNGIGSLGSFPKLVGLTWWGSRVCYLAPDWTISKCSMKSYEFFYFNLTYSDGEIS